MMYLFFYFFLYIFALDGIFCGKVNTYIKVVKDVVYAVDVIISDSNKQE